MNPLALVWPSLLRLVARLAPPKITPVMWGEKTEQCSKGTQCPCYQRGFQAGEAEASAVLR